MCAHALVCLDRVLPATCMASTCRSRHISMSTDTSRFSDTGYLSWTLLQLGEGNRYSLPPLLLNSWRVRLTLLLVMATLYLRPTYQSFWEAHT